MKLTNNNRVVLFSIIGLCLISIIYRFIPRSIVSSKVTLQLDLSQEETPGLQGLIAKFREQNPNIIIVPVSHSYKDLEKKFLENPSDTQELDKKRAKSDLIMLDMDWVPNVIKNKGLAPLAGFPKDDPDLAMLYEASKINGESYAIPLFSDMYVFFYNIDILKTAGFDRPPKDRDEFIRYSQALKAKNIAGIGMALSGDNHSGMFSDIYSWFWDSGISFIKDNKPQFLSKPVTETISFLDTLNKEALISPDSFAKSEQAKISEFCSGKTAMMVASLAAVQEIRSRVTFNWGISSIPSAASYIGKPLFVTESYGIGIYESSEHKEEAWKFIAFLADAEANGELASAYYSIPRNQNAKALFIQESPQLEKAVTLFNAGEGVNEFDFHTGAFTVEGVVRDELQVMMTKGRSPELTARAIQDKLEAGF